MVHFQAGVCRWGQDKRRLSELALENFLLLITDYSSTGQGHPLNEPYHLRHFLLQGNQFKQSAEPASHVEI